MALDSAKGPNLENSGDDRDEMDLSPEEREALDSIRHGSSWPTQGYLLSHPRVAEAVLESEEGTSTLKSMLESAIPTERRGEFLRVAREYMIQNKNNESSAAALAIAGGIPVLGAAAVVLYKGFVTYLNNKGFVLPDPGASMTYLALAAGVLGGSHILAPGIQGVDHQREMAHKLDEAMKDVFGADWHHSEEDHEGPAVEALA